MKQLAKAILFITIFLHTNGLDAQDDFISALRLDHWAPGTLVLKDGGTVQGEINYDYANHFVQVKQADSIRLFSERIASTLHFDWFDTPDKTTFRNLNINGPERMYRVLYENSQMAFLSYYEVDIKTDGPLASTTRPKGIAQSSPAPTSNKAREKTIWFRSWRERFLLITATGDIRELGSFFILPANNKGQMQQGALMTKKSLAKNLKDLFPNAKSYLADKRIDLDNRHHIMQVFQKVIATLEE